MAMKVNDRIKLAIDLHAADAVYHRQCSVNFRRGKNNFQILLYAYQRKNDSIRYYVMIKNTVINISN